MKSSLLLAAAVLAAAPVSNSRADVVSDWNAAFEATLQNPSERGPRVPVRTWAILHAAMFDAVNGIARKYEPLHVTSAPPPGARAEAAAIQAAHTVLSTLRPAFQTAFDTQLEVSLANLPGDPGNSVSIARGRAWGAQVAQAILAWRASDNATAVLPPFSGSTAVGYWRHAPLQASPTSGYSNLVTVPFVVAQPMDFDPGPPYGQANRTVALQGSLYAADVNEVRNRGGTTSSQRTADDLAHALFNHACDVASMNRLLRTRLSHPAALVDTARAFALLNITAFDTTVVFFRLKYHHALWRPFQAIQYAAEVPNPALTADPAWTSYLPTPPHPEYPSAHVTLFAALLHVVQRVAGDLQSVELTAPGFAPRTYGSLAHIRASTRQGRIDLGYHFRDTCDASDVVGEAVGNHIVDHAMQPRR